MKTPKEILKKLVKDAMETRSDNINQALKGIEEYYGNLQSLLDFVNLRLLLDFAEGKKGSKLAIQKSIIEGLKLRIREYAKLILRLRSELAIQIKTDKELVTELVDKNILLESKWYVKVRKVFDKIFKKS